MGYGLIALAGSVALTSVYVLATEASRWSKAFLTGLLFASLFWHYGLYLQVILGVFLSLYFAYLNSRS